MAPVSIARLITAGLVAFSLVALPFFASSPANAADKKKIVVGTEPTFPPFESKDEQGNFVGFDIDLVKAIAAKQGLTVEFKDLPFDSLIPALQSGQIDVIASGLSITEERKKAVDYSEPYFDAGLSIAVRKNNDKIKSSADLKGKTVAVQQGSTGATKAEALEKGVLRGIRQFPTVPLAMMELTKGGVDAVINDRPVSEAFVAAQAGEIKLLEEVIDADSYGLAVRKGNAELLKEINAGLAALKADGTVQQIKDKYFKAAAVSEPAKP
jgi:glutamine transport system substrate-binding protein